MERMTRFRAGLLVCLFMAILCFYCFRLYRVQVVDTGGDTNNITTFETRTRVKAARGNILDRNGNVLVTNRASYDLTINHFVLTSSADPNGTLYQLAQLCKERDIDYVDHLPISNSQPFEYTLDEYSTTWQSHFQTFLASRDHLDSDMSAPLLMRKLRESYLIPEEWSDEDARLVLGMRYELTLRTCVGSLSNYIFLSDVDNDTLAAVLELNIPGMNVESSTVREYSTEYAAHILGYVGAMNATQWEYYKKLDGYSMDALVGQSGLEEAFEEYLHGTDGSRVDVVTKDGTLVKSYYEVEPKAGQNVQVSIDLNLQSAAEDALALAIEGMRSEDTSQKGWDAQGAAVVAMDIKTGQVLVCGSYPTYDLSTLFENYNDLLNADLQPMYDRALQAIYPPGSTYKMSMTVAGIQAGEIGRWTQICDNGAFTKYPGMSPKCLVYSSSGRTHGYIDCTEALKVSCNYFYYELADRLSIDMIDSTAKSLGLGEHTGIELYEAVGYRSNPESKAALYSGDDSRWYKGDQILTGIGQAENRFTPIQLCTYAATLANQGVRYKATFLNRVVTSDYSSVVYENAVTVMSEMDMSDEAYDAVLTGMKKVASESGGTAYKVFGDYPVQVAAKTGTAQTGIQGHSDNGAFVCFAPADDPQIAVVVYGERAGSGGNLAPVAKAVLDAYFGTEAGDTITGENQVG
ncbi:MAG: penicillin-binding protein [Oscillospiraceae bacterium]|nr:penicillin-binding protein [Oscillospiraceae bacterium]